LQSPAWPPNLPRIAFAQNVTFASVAQESPAADICHVTAYAAGRSGYYPSETRGAKCGGVRPGDSDAIAERLPMTEHRPPSDQTPPVVVARAIGAPPLAPSPPDLELPYVRRGEAALDLALVLLAAVILPYAPSFLAPDVDVENVGVPSGIGPMVIFQVWCQAALAVGLLLYFIMRHRMRPASFGVRRERILEQVLWGFGALLGVYLALVATAVIVMLVYVVSPQVEDDLTRRFDFVTQMPVDNLAATLILLVAVAVNEEVVFRGLLLPYLRRVLGSWSWAAVISALIFAGLHVPQQGVLGGGIQIFTIGIVLSVFFLLSRSLLAVTLAHLLFDFLQFQLIRVLPDLERLFEGLQSELPAAAGLMGAIP
jgi:membrane protease YdiL (CAAX protease family)